MTLKLMMKEEPVSNPQATLDRDREEIHRKMLSSVSHDLKTPLASVIGSLEIYERMKDKLPLDKREQLINTALQEAYRLDSFVTNILEMAKLEYGMVKPYIDAVDIKHLLQDCTAKLGHRLKKADIYLLPLDEPNPIVRTDSVLLSRVIGHVLDNAARYGGASTKITIAYGKDDNGDLHIDIKDEGSGIPAGNEEAVFAKYTRFAKQDQQQAGTGLGLSICREMMRLLNGHISASNSSDSGAIFKIVLHASK